MKKLIAFAPWWIKAPVATIGFIIGVYMSVEAWVISKANTVVEPTRVKINLMEDYQRIHQDRVELELRMIRSSQDETNKYLRELR